MYIYIYICTYMCIYIYIYREREIEREREMSSFVRGIPRRRPHGAWLAFQQCWDYTKNSSPYVVIMMISNQLINNNINYTKYIRTIPINKAHDDN